MLIGDSITGGYALAVRARLRGRANVHLPAENGGSTEVGLTRLSAWVGADHWDIVHFNFGLHYLWRADKRRQRRDSEKGQVFTSLPVYEKNLQEIVLRLKSTGARLIFATTTPVPAGSYGRIEGDERPYNEVAKRVIQENGVAIDDLCAYAAPRVKQIQLAHDVHFVSAGYRQIADVVTASIIAALPTQPLRLRPPPAPSEKWAGQNLNAGDAAVGLQWIPPGSFQMGSVAGGYDDERPVTTVHITRGFWLGRYEVTKNNGGL